MFQYRHLTHSRSNKNEKLVAEVVVYGDKALADESQTANWLAYGRTQNERRFSPSDQIDTGNVTNLKVDWILDLPNDVGLVSTRQVGWKHNRASIQ